MTAPTEAQVAAGAARLTLLGQQVGNRFIQSNARHLAREVLTAAMADTDAPSIYSQGYPGEAEVGHAIQWWIAPTWGNHRWSEWADVIAVDKAAWDHHSACDVAPGPGFRCLLLRFADGSERALWFSNDVLRLARRVPAREFYQTEIPEAG